MYNLIILDDEEIALNGLANYIDWTSLGFQVIGTARTIEEALTVITTSPVDVILTDIQLEESNGLDLLRQLRADNVDIECVILSGHGKFEYAQTALRYSAFDFLTKPVQFDALRATFQSLYLLLEQKQIKGTANHHHFEMKKTLHLNNLAKDTSTSIDLATLHDLRITTQGPLYLTRVHLNEKYSNLNELDNDKSLVKTILLQSFGEQNLSFEIFNNTLNEYAII